MTTEDARCIAIAHIKLAVLRNDLPKLPNQLCIGVRKLARMMSENPVIGYLGNMDKH